MSSVQIPLLTFHLTCLAIRTPPSVPFSLLPVIFSHKFCIQSFGTKYFNIFPQNKDIFLNNHSVITNFIKMPQCSALIHHPYSTWTTDLNNICHFEKKCDSVFLPFQEESSLWSYIAFSYLVSHFSFGTLSRICLLWHWHFWRLQNKSCPHIPFCFCFTLLFEKF